MAQPDERSLVHDGDVEATDAEGFPVMVRLTEIQRQFVSLTERLDRLAEVLDRVERALAGGPAARPVWRSVEEPFPVGITARANPMTHPITPLSAPATPDTGRDQALAQVRTLFLSRRRSWWQRLPELLRS